MAKIKEVSNCPNCDQPLRKTGQRRPEGSKPIDVYTCVNGECREKGSFTRKGTRLNG